MNGGPNRWRMVLPAECMVVLLLNSISEYKDLRNYDRLHGFIESTHQILTTGKAAFQLP